MSDRERLTWTIYDSPVGPLTLVAGPEGIRNIHFPGRTAAPAEAARGPLPVLADQLDAYFAGQLRASTSTSTSAATGCSCSSGGSCSRSPTRHGHLRRAGRAD